MSADTKVGLVPLDRIDFHPHNVRADLGDLRSLTDSIRRFGVMQPVVLEVRGDRLRVRAGHRRVTAARIAGLTKVPAVVHGDALEDDEWLIAAAHENTRRRDLDRADRARAVSAMRELGMRWEAVADALGVATSTAKGYVHEEPDEQERREVLDEKWDHASHDIAVLTREGYSARQIAAMTGQTPRNVVRHRSGARSISTGIVRTIATLAREREWSADDLLTVLDALAATGALSSALESVGGAA